MTSEAGSCLQPAAPLVAFDVDAVASCSYWLGLQLIGKVVHQQQLHRNLHHHHRRHQQKRLLDGRARSVQQSSMGASEVQSG